VSRRCPGAGSRMRNSGSRTMPATTRPRYTGGHRLQCTPHTRAAKAAA
jgi:hypothetical protein